MGCFGYICKGCNSSIRGNCWNGGEKTIMIHVRNGKELGRVEGHYDEYGRVIEQEGLSEEERFRGDSKEINGHTAICESELRLEDSYCKVKEMRDYNGRQIDFYGYASAIIAKEQENHYDDIRKSRLYEYVEEDNKEDIEKAYLEGKNHIALAHFSLGLDMVRYKIIHSIVEEFNKLPLIKKDKYSGIVAWHSKCYNAATEGEKEDLTPSDWDPNQSWGKVRKKYI